MEKSIGGKSLHGFDALGADVLSVKGHNVLCAVAEDAGGLILLHHNAGAVDIDFQTVALCDIQRAAQFDGEDNAAQFINFAHDTSRFHFFHPFPEKTVSEFYAYL